MAYLKQIVLVMLLAFPAVINANTKPYVSIIDSRKLEEVNSIAENVADNIDGKIVCIGNSKGNIYKVLLNNDYKIVDVVKKQVIDGTIDKIRILDKVEIYRVIG